MEIARVLERKDGVKMIIVRKKSDIKKGDYIKYTKFDEENRDEKEDIEKKSIPRTRCIKDIKNEKKKEIIKEYKILKFTITELKRKLKEKDKVKKYRNNNKYESKEKVLKFTVAELRQKINKGKEKLKEEGFIIKQKDEKIEEYAKELYQRIEEIQILKGKKRK